jgi:hypothetical protein
VETLAWNQQAGVIHEQKTVLDCCDVAFNLTVGIAVIAGDPDSLGRRHPHRPVSDGRAGYGVASGFEHNLLDHHNGRLHLVDALNQL